MKVPVFHVYVKKHVDSEKFGARGSISEEDWEEIAELLSQHNIKSVLEFGGGLSTKRYCNRGLKVVCLETNLRWAEIVAENCPSATVIRWDNKEFPKNRVGNGLFDLVFIDGADPRENQVIHGKECGDKLLIHDTKRKQEQELIQKYLSDWKATKLSNGRLTFVENLS